MKWLDSITKDENGDVQERILVNMDESYTIELFTKEDEKKDGERILIVESHGIRIVYRGDKFLEIKSKNKSEAEGLIAKLSSFLSKKLYGVALVENGKYKTTLREGGSTG